MRRTAEDAARTRVALMRAALFAFAELGWRGATFEQIADRAGMTRGALHHHFRSKTALLEAALEWGWARFGDGHFENPSSAGIAEDGTETSAANSAETWLADLLNSFVTRLREDELFRALAMTTVLVAPQSEGDISAKNAALDGWRDQIIANLHDRSTPLPARETAGMVLVVLNGLVLTAVHRPDDLPRPETQDAAITALVTGLLGT